MALMLGMHREGGDGGWGREANGAMEGLRAVVSLQGIFSFGLCRDRHLGSREVYDSFTTGAFGPESEGGWEKGDLIQCGRGVGEGVDVVVLGHSRGDELVEWEQAVGMGEVLGREGREGVGVVVEVEGGHQEVISGGEGLGRCVVVAVAMLVERSKGGRGGMIGKRAEGEAGLQVLQA